MYYYVYLIVNLINGKYYIGAHATNNLHDGYMGSGYLIQAAIEKYGVEYFVKEILRYCDTREEMFEYEAELVTQDLVDDPMCYNMKLGGIGGCVRKFTDEERKERRRVVNQAHYIANKEKLNKQSADYYEIHKSHLNEYMKEYSRTHKESIHKSNREWHQKNKEKVNAYRRTRYARKKAVQNAQ